MNPIQRRICFFLLLLFVLSIVTVGSIWLFGKNLEPFRSYFCYVNPPSETSVTDNNPAPSVEFEELDLEALPRIEIVGDFVDDVITLRNSDWFEIYAQKFPFALTLDAVEGNMEDVVRLKEQRNLKSLYLDIQTNSPFDPSFLGEMPWLSELGGCKPGSFLLNLDNLRRLEISGDLIVDHLANMQNLKHLERLTLKDSLRVSPEVAGMLKILPNLKSLVLKRMYDSSKNELNESLDCLLQTLDQLESLDLCGMPQINASNLNSLKKLTHLKSLKLPPLGRSNSLDVELPILMSLEELNLNSWPVSDSFLENIGAMTQLKSLTFCCQKATAAGLKRLSSLKNLESLTLYCDSSLLTPEILSSLIQLNDLPNFTSLTIFDLNRDITDENLAELAKLPRLKSLEVFSSYGGEQKLTDKALEIVAGITGLEKLRIPKDNKFTASGLQFLKQLKSLKELFIVSSGIERSDWIDFVHEASWIEQVPSFIIKGQWGGQYLNKTDAGLKAFVERNPQSQIVDLSRNPYISHVGLASLKALPHLQKLNLCFCDQLTDSDMSELAGLWELKELNLTGCGQITDAGLKHLSGLPNLSTVRIDKLADPGLNVQLTRDCIKSLAAIKSLEEINLKGCETITDKDLAAYRGNWPKLRIVNGKPTDLGLKQGTFRIGWIDRMFLKDNCFVTDAGLPYMLKKYTNAREIQLDNCERITGSGLKFEGNFENLRKLFICRCPQASGTVLNQLRRSPARQRLTHLTLSGSLHLTDADLSSLEYLPSLSDLDLSNNPQLSDASLEYIKKVFVPVWNNGSPTTFYTKSVRQIL